MLYSIALFLTLMAQSNASEDVSPAVRGAPNSNNAKLVSESTCFDNSDCDDNYFCHVPDGDCLMNGTEGECYEIQVPRTRSLRWVWVGLCGCDGNTYLDRSYAAAAGVNVDFIGSCEDTEIALSMSMLLEVE